MTLLAAVTIAFLAYVAGVVTIPLVLLAVYFYDRRGIKRHLDAIEREGKA